MTSIDRVVTGFKDVNNQLIRTGDIVIPGNLESAFDVTDIGLVVKNRDIKPQEGLQESHEFSIEWCDSWGKRWQNKLNNSGPCIEVIGNIDTNKKLVKERWGFY